MELIKEPHIQLGIYLFILFLAMIISKLNSGTVIMYGISTFLVWIPVSTFAGISTDYDWWYYAYLTGSFMIAYVILWVCFYITDKYGSPCNGEGAIVIVAPLTFAVVLIPLSLVIKLIWNFFAMPG